METILGNIDERNNDSEAAYEDTYFAKLFGLEHPRQRNPYTGGALIANRT
jgi:hypothetical protein